MRCRAAPGHHRGDITIDGDARLRTSSSREGRPSSFAAAVTVTISGSRSFNSRAQRQLPTPTSASRSPVSATTRRSAATCSSTAPARRICQAARAGSRPPEGSTHDDPRISGLHAGAVALPGWRGRSAIVAGCLTCGDGPTRRHQIALSFWEVMWRPGLGFLRRTIG